MIVHAGSSGGFLPLDLKHYIFEGKITVDGDYHKNMDATILERWFSKVLDTLTEPSVIVMDNASYHSRCTEDYPTSKWTKPRLQQWLSAHSIAWSREMLRPELLGEGLVKLHRPLHKEYICDQVVELRGHQVVRLPLYHSDLNPIELVWAQLKENVGRLNTVCGLKEVKKLLIGQFSSITPDKWEHCCKHVEKIEADYWESDRSLELLLDPVIICDSGSDSESDGDSDSNTQLESDSE